MLAQSKECWPKNHIEIGNGEGLYIFVSNNDDHEQCPHRKNNIMNSDSQIVLIALVPAQFSI